MLKIEKIDHLYDRNLLYLIYTVLLCVILILLLNVTEELTHNILSKDTYEILHFFSDLLSIFVSFSVFAVLYYTYEEFNSLRNIILSQAFLITGILEVFYLFFYKEIFSFTPKDALQYEILFWLLSRLIMTSGIFTTSIIEKRKKVYIKKEVFLFSSLVITSIFLLITSFTFSYIPQLVNVGQGPTIYSLLIEYLIISLLLIASFTYIKEYFLYKNKLICIFVIALILGVFTEVSYTLFSNLYDIYIIIAHFFKVLSYYVIFHTLFLANIKMPYRKLENMKNKVDDYAHNLEDLVNEKTEKLVKANLRLQNVNKKMIADIEAAKSIQQALLPNKSVKYKGVSFYSEYIPCERLSGDFFNYFKIDEENIAAYIVDVSGHGLSAAMLTIFLDRSLRIKEGYYGGKYSILEPKEVLTILYEVFNNSNFPDETHIVMIYGIYNIRTKTFKYSSAGHNCPLIKISENNGVEILDENRGFPICKLGKFYKPTYKNYEINLNKNDKLLFFTDGLTELKNREIYTLEKLLHLLKNNKNLDSEELIKLISKDLFKYKNPNFLEDDITFFIMESTL
ncbi:MASE3 domain-containing protein [Thermohalobacter berrensis]|uniref:PPM-type phosphatase domain-containing protein n=1 Tax=Thermohalobacter berrensis TaxID=99594 RepID=A0A419T9S4_9FIRM|nr:MASE3 domain-containing protein [Thermohalobacter berrensis]RKD34215.1 hypothetical protein BET03_07970 [Thermohalobacter berrensis]